MEAALRKFNSIAEQYCRSHHNSSLAIELQKQLETLINFTSSNNFQSEFQANCLMVTECVTKLIMLIRDPEVKSFISQKIMNLFLNLSNIPAIHSLLKFKFHLTSTLASFLCLHFEKENDPAVLQCLDLLKCHTYRIKVRYPEGYLDDLLAFLLNFIQKKPPHSLRLPCLIVLANLCRKNPVVQKRIHNMEDRAGFYRYLLNMINSDGEHMLLISALSTFTSLAIEDDVGAKLFNPDNVYHTFVLIFTLILQKDVDVVCCAVDLLINMLSNEKMQHHLLCFKHFDVSINKMLDLLTLECNHKIAAKIYELLLEACSVNSLCVTISTLISKHEYCSSVKTHPITVSIHFLSEKLDGTFDVPICAANFLILILKDLNAWKNPDLDEQLFSLVTCIMEDLSTIWQTPCVEFEKACEKGVANLMILILLYRTWHQTNKRVVNFSTDTLLDLLEMHLDNELNDKSNKGNASNGLRSIDIILNILNLMVVLKGSVPDIEEHLNHYLQDSRVLHVLAAAFASDSYESIQIAVELLILGERLTSFPRLKFCDLLKKCNNKNSRTETFKACDITIHNSSNSLPFAKRNDRPSFITRTNGDGSDKMEISMKNLIDRMEKDLQVSDLKSSQIMQMYEHKISSLEMKEKHLQDLLDSKTIALQHSDRLLSQYRCRWAQSDAEALQLRTLLQESELRSETAKEEATKALLGQQALQLKLQTAVEDALSLDVQIEELKDNNFAYNNKIQSLQDKIERQKQENHSMSEFNAVLQRRNEEYKLKEEELAESITQLEIEKKTVLKQLKEKEAKLIDLQKMLQNFKNQLKRSEEEVAKLEDSVTSLKAMEKQLEKDLEESREKVTSKEMSISQLESKNELLESELAKLKIDLENCQKELEKHKQLAAMIHSMSASGMK